MTTNRFLYHRICLKHFLFSISLFVVISLSILIAIAISPSMSLIQLILSVRFCTKPNYYRVRRFKIRLKLTWWSDDFKTIENINIHHLIAPHHYTPSTFNFKSFISHPLSHCWSLPSWSNLADGCCWSLVVQWWWR